LETIMTRYLIAYDGSPAAQEAVARLVGLYREGDAVGVVGVSHGPIGGTQFNRAEREQEAAASRAEVDQAVALLRDHGIEAAAVAASGDPASAICAAAADGAFDLIVIGSRNLHGPRRLALGSVSSGVVNHADCDVMIVKGARS
jgi:nucleotide-binding universal stress UspA family protein